MASIVDIVIRTVSKGTGVKDTDSDLEKLGKSVLKISAVVTAFGLAAKKAFDLGQQGAQVLRLQEAGNNLARSYGANMNTILASLNKAARGTVAQTDLILGANRAMMLGLGADAQQLGNLLEVAAFRGRAMGLSTTQAFNDIVTGVGRMSPLILDNLGIVIDADKRYREWAASTGMSVDQIDSATKRQILLNAVLEEGNEQLEAAGGLADDAASSYERFSAQTKNLWQNILAGETAMTRLVDFLADDIERQNEAMAAAKSLGGALVFLGDQAGHVGSGIKLATGEIITIKEAMNRASFDPFIRTFLSMPQAIEPPIKDTASLMEELNKKTANSFILPSPESVAGRFNAIMEALGIAIRSYGNIAVTMPINFKPTFSDIPSVPSTPRTRTTQQNIPGLAMGGPLSSRLTEVGERGAEYLWEYAPGKYWVFDAQQTKKMKTQGIMAGMFRAIAGELGGPTGSGGGVQTPFSGGAVSTETEREDFNIRLLKTSGGGGGGTTISGGAGGAGGGSGSAQVIAGAVATAAQSAASGTAAAAIQESRQVATMLGERMTQSTNKRTDELITQVNVLIAEVRKLAKKDDLRGAFREANQFSANI